MILEQARKNKLPIPSKILNAPQLKTGLQFYYQAFHSLSTCRSLGMGAGPIPWTAVREYADQYDLAEDEFERLLLIISYMDDVYLEHIYKKSKSKSGK